MFKIDGFTDSHTQCDRCGKSELKGTYHITTDAGDTFYLGSSCIKKAYQMTQKEFTKKVADDYKERERLAKLELLQHDEVIIAKRQYETAKIEHGHYVTFFDLDMRELGRDYAMRFLAPANEICKTLKAKYNLTHLHW